MTFDNLLRWLSKAGLILCVAFLVLFAGDYLVLRIRIAIHGVDRATAHVTTFEAALLKDNKYNVYFDQPQIQTCVLSVFPWLGDAPCWYLRRHSIKIVN